MNKKILEEKDLTIPIKYTGKCEKALDVWMQRYTEILNKYSADPELIQRVDSFRKSIARVFTEYYLGHQNRAYGIFWRALEKQVAGKGLVSSNLPRTALYRARINAGDRDFPDDEMFHIPYNLRGKVTTQRFSFPGLPCLYLGGSSYVCWLELNRPQLDQFQVATIWQVNQNKEFSMIDLGIHPKKFLQELEAREKNESTEHADLSLEDYLQWWPVIAMCSVMVEKEIDTFKPEYILPQFMLQYMLEKTKKEEYLGIKYLSIKAGKTSLKQYEANEKFYTNYVIPIRSSAPNEKQLCPYLSMEFSVVRNYSGKELQVWTDMIRNNGMTYGEPLGELVIDENDVIYGTNDDGFPYSKSVFSRIEKILNSQIDRNADNSVIKFATMDEKKVEKMIDEKLKSKIRVEGSTLIIGD